MKSFMVKLPVGVPVPVNEAALTECNDNEHRRNDQQVFYQPP